MSAGPTWYRNHTNCLRRSENLFGNLFDNNLEVSNSSFKTMADNENNRLENVPPVVPPVRTLHVYLQPTRTSTPSCMIFLINVGTFEIKPGVNQLLPIFHGHDSESAYLHLKEFDEVCAMLQCNNVTEDVVRLRQFPFSLKEKVKAWFHSLKPRSIGTWAEMTRNF